MYKKTYKNATYCIQFKRISQNEKGDITFLRSEHELLVMGSSKLQVTTERIKCRKLVSDI